MNFFVTADDVTPVATPSAKTPSEWQPSPTTRLAIQPVILAGGAGTRLWPLSREQYPKQLLALLGEDSLLAATASRLDGLVAPLPLAPDTVVVCGEAHRFICSEHLQRSGHRVRLLTEPVGRNTAPALTLAALASADPGRDAVLVVMPADHVVTDRAAFQRALAEAIEHAMGGAIVTLGVVPARAETGYGYIKIGALIDNAAATAAEALPATPPDIRCTARALERFVEKPHLELAEQYVASGEYWWNSGILVLRASVWLAALTAFEPEMAAACQTAFAQGRHDGALFRPDAKEFAACRADSVDYAVLERLGAQPPDQRQSPVVVVPLHAGWSDLGSWQALWEATPKSAEGNVARGRVIFENSYNNLVHSEGRLIACIGLRDAVVVETPDAVLVADRAQVQDVKQVVAQLKASAAPEADNHRKVHRPWGHYDSLDSGERFQVKRIVVAPNSRLSLQMHYHRAEHWIVVRGTARVTCGEQAFLLSENQSTYIPIGVKHRLENPGKTPLEIIEVQSGAYLGEDDIVRFDDSYGRG